VISVTIEGEVVRSPPRSAPTVRAYDKAAGPLGHSEGARRYAVAVITPAAPPVHHDR
jgi:hypothetical protein